MRLSVYRIGHSSWPQSSLEALEAKYASTESELLLQPIAPGNARTLRDFLLGKLELFLMNHWSKSNLEDSLRESARDLGKDAIIPTTMKQFQKLTAFLEGRVKIYVACCEVCTRDAETCHICKQPLWINKRPRHVFFVRSVKEWLADLLKVPALKNAINHYRKRKVGADVIADVLDGKVARDLEHEGM